MTRSNRAISPLNDAETELEDNFSRYSAENRDRANPFQNTPQELEKAINKISTLLPQELDADKKKIINMRIAEARNLSGTKLTKYQAFLEAQIELLTATHAMHENINPDKIYDSIFHQQHEHTSTTHHHDDTILVNQAKNQFHETYLDAAEKISILAYNLLKSPFTAVQPQDIKLLANTVNSLHTFVLNPGKKDNMTALIANTQLIYRKMGTFWTSIKNALTAVIGAGCIVVGVLGLVPSFGASISLMVAGGLLCTHAGLSSFKMNTSFINPIKKTADDTKKDVQQLFKEAKQLLSYVKIINNNEIESTATLRPSV